MACATDQEFSVHLRMIAALAFVPVVNAFEELPDTISRIFNADAYGTCSIVDELPRTKNHVEGCYTVAAIPPFLKLKQRFHLITSTQLLYIITLSRYIKHRVRFQQIACCTLTYPDLSEIVNYDDGDNNYKYKQEFHR